MRRFKSGQQVVCTHPTGMWLGVFPGPKMGEIVTVNKYSEIHKDSLELMEYDYSNVGNLLPDCYRQCWFEPLADLKQLEYENDIHLQWS
jgi:hypothetical protein